jgi:hypothetical protein
VLTRAEGSFLAATEAVNEVDADESTGKKGEKVVTTEGVLLVFHSIQYAI